MSECGVYTPKVMMGVYSLLSCLSCKISNSEEDIRLASCPVRGVRRYIEQMQVVHSSDKVLSSFPKQAGMLLQYLSMSFALDCRKLCP